MRVRLQGGEVGAWQRFIHLPEEWVRADEHRGVFSTIRTACLAILLLGVVSYTLFLLARKSPPGRIRWKTGFKIAGAVALVELLGEVLGWRTLLVGYDTSQPWSHFLVESALLVPVGILLTALLLGVGLAMLPAINSRLMPALHRRHRCVYARDAFVGAVVIVAWVSILTKLGTLLATWFTGATPPATHAVPPGVESALPFVSGVGVALTGACLAALIVGFALLIIRHREHTPLATPALILIASVALVPGPIHSVGAFLAGWLANVAVAVVALGLMGVVLRDNVPAYLIGCLVLGAGGVWRQLSANPVTHLDAWILIALLAAGVGLFFVRGCRIPEVAAKAD
jgi:hypothetical protein